MQSPEKTYKQLTKTLAELFFPLAEVALFNKKNVQLCHFNSLTNETLSESKNQKIKTILINKNQQVKITSIKLTAGYYLRVIADISLFLPLQAMLKQYIPCEEADKSLESWQVQVENTIEDFLCAYHKKFNDLNSQDKRALVLRLQEAGLFRYQDATKLVAARLNISRATLYNYLKQASELKSLEIHQVDAFTNEPFSGNPAGVVLDAAKLSDTLMKKIAREMNLSETSFILPSKKADFKLRYFTPSGDEVKLCGHSTVGALYMLAHEKLFGINKSDQYHFTMETGVGLLPVAINTKKKEAISIEYQTPKVDLITSEISHDELANALGIPLAAINTEISVMFERTNQDLYLTINSLKTLGELKINDKSAKQFALANNIVVYTLVTNETVEKENDLHLRCFAPAVGISEDPFTGSVLGGLASYARQHSLIKKNKKTILVEQGHFISRPGYVKLETNPKSLTASVRVIAKARHFFSTKVNL